MTDQKIIVKVQLPLASTETNPPVLIYNEDRSIEEMFPMTKEMAMLCPEMKSFHFAHIDENKKLVIGQEAPFQDW